MRKITCLFADVGVGRGEEGDEVGDGARLHHELGLLRGAGGDVRQSPRSLKANGIGPLSVDGDVMGIKTISISY